MNIFFFLFVLSSPLWAINSYECSPETYKVEFQSPMTQGKKISCVYNKDGKVLKHGKEWIFDKDGKLVREAFYVNDKEAAFQEPSAKINSDDEMQRESFEAITQILKVLSMRPDANINSKFQVQACDKDSKAWIKAALTKGDLPRSYAFGDHCDVESSFTASFKNEFNVSFKLRNLWQFNLTDMKVTMELKREGAQIRYMFNVLEGSSIKTSSDQKVIFKAHYEVDVDPLSGATLYETQKGTMTILKINQKEINVTNDLRL